jgi:hypothetical protein
VIAGERAKAFLIMPFERDLDWLRDTIIEAALEENVDTIRADNIFSPGAILQQILQNIDNADLIFAVCTGKNANVFFELGYAWLHHKPILIAESTEDLPFDIAAFRAELYGHDHHGADRHSLNLRLRRAIQAALAEERLPRGRILKTQKLPAARLTAALHETGGRGSYRLVISNTGNVDLKGVDVDIPAEATSLHIHTDPLPVDILRPGESIKLHASVVMGGGKSVFDIILNGVDPDGQNREFPSKISL